MLVTNISSLREFCCRSEIMKSPRDLWHGESSMIMGFHQGLNVHLVVTGNMSFIIGDILQRFKLTIGSGFRFRQMDKVICREEKDDAEQPKCSEEFQH